MGNPLAGNLVFLYFDFDFYIQCDSGERGLHDYR